MTRTRLDQVRRVLADDAEFPLDDTLLYARVGRNVVSPSVFKDRGADILYREPDLDRLGDVLLDLWEAEDPGKRWAEIEYVIRGDRFETVFTYPEEIDPEEDPLDRRDRVVAKYFGDKPIVYPPFPSHLRPFEL